MEDWAEIRRWHRSEQMAIRAIARHLGISKNTVKKALASDGPPQYQRPATGSIVDAVEPQIRELLREFGGHALDRDRRADRLDAQPDGALRSDR